MTAPPPTLEDLRPRQREVAALIAEGLIEKRIAARLRISHTTVRVHIAALAYALRLPTGHNTKVLIANWYRDQLRAA